MASPYVLCQLNVDVCVELWACWCELCFHGYRGVPKFGPIENIIFFLRPQRAQEGLAQPRAWSEGDVSAEHWF